MDTINKFDNHRIEDKKCNLNNSIQESSLSINRNNNSNSNNNSDIYIIMNNNAKSQYSPVATTTTTTSTSTAAAATMAMMVNDSTSKQQDLVHQFKYFWMFGRIINVLPIIGMSKGRVEAARFRRASFATFTSCIISISLTFCTVVGIIGFFLSKKQNANELAWSAHLSVFYATGLFIYIYFLRYSREFLLLLKKWKYTHLNYPTEDLTLKRDVNIIAGLVLTSIVLENVSWHFKHFFAVAEETSGSNCTNPEDNESALQKFYENSEPEWSLVFVYHPVTAIFVIVTNKWAIYSWNFFDILIIIISRAMSFKFKTLTAKADEYLNDSSCVKEPARWKQFMEDHLVLTDLLSACDNFLAPIIFLSYCVNIYNVCIHLSLGLSPAWNSTTIGSIYAVWAFSHLIARLYVVSISAARINEHALNMCRVLKKCPIELYDKETEKFERQLFCKEIGLSGLGYFTVTKSFMLRLLGVIFTVEIVLLQNPISPDQSSGEVSVNAMK